MIQQTGRNHSLGPIGVDSAPVQCQSIPDPNSSPQSSELPNRTKKRKEKETKHVTKALFYRQFDFFLHQVGVFAVQQLQGHHIGHHRPTGQNCIKLWEKKKIPSSKESKAPELKQWQAVWAKRASIGKPQEKFAPFDSPWERPRFQLRPCFNNGTLSGTVILTICDAVNEERSLTSATSSRRDHPTALSSFGRTSGTWRHMYLKKQIFHRKMANPSEDCVLGKFLPRAKKPGVKNQNKKPGVKNQNKKPE